MLSFDTIAARSLNACRHLHKPTYAGLRLLLGRARQVQTPFLRLLQNRTQTRDTWRYFSFHILKEANKNDVPVYRNCIIGSPLTTAAEVHVLGLMASQASFQLPTSTYSYLWPRGTHSGRSFEYFYEGYSRRNVHVGEALNANPGYVAIVNDIKKFYPSVNKQRLRKRVGTRINGVSDTADAMSIRRFIDGLLTLTSPRTEGIPIGPSISHVLGNVALESVDAAMNAEYPGRYFRYVDDTVVVCSPAESAKVTRRLRDLLSEEGLSLHEGKQDEVNGSVWIESHRSHSNISELASFSGLVDDIILYFLRCPNEIGGLSKRLHEEGFSLPTLRLGSLARSRRYRMHKRSLFRRRRGLFDWAKSWFVTESTIVKKATMVRREMLALAAQLSESSIPAQSLPRRIYLQRRRFLFNRLFYLLSPSEYPQLLKLMPEVDEFTENRAVAAALAANDGASILRFPGGVVDSFCQIASERGERQLTVSQWPVNPSRAEAESIAHLCLYFSITPPQAFVDSLSLHTPGGRILIDLCRGASTEGASVERFSFLDEMSLLFGAATSDELRQVMNSRFDELEEIGLDALYLGESESPFESDSEMWAH